MAETQFQILFVCSGNSCRSPMAEGLLRQKIPDDLRDKVSIQSAGTLGINDSPATDFAVYVTNELGADISSHRSQGMTEELSHADIIFAMAINHKEYLNSHFPSVRENVFLLRAFDQPADQIEVEDIGDPIGGTLEIYRECAQLIDRELDRIMPRLEELIRNHVGG